MYLVQVVVSCCVQCMHTLTLPCPGSPAVDRTQPLHLPRRLVMHDVMSLERPKAESPLPSASVGPWGQIRQAVRTHRSRGLTLTLNAVVRISSLRNTGGRGEGVTTRTRIHFETMAHELSCESQASGPCPPAFRQIA